MGIFDWISGKEKFQKDTLQLGENCFIYFAASGEVSFKHIELQSIDEEKNLLNAIDLSVHKFRHFRIDRILRVFGEKELKNFTEDDIQQIIEDYVEELTKEAEKNNKKNKKEKKLSGSQNKRFNQKRVVDRNIDELIGLARGILADGKVDQVEAETLQKWLIAVSGMEHPMLHNLLVRVNEMLEDGVLDEEESAELFETLNELTGGTFETGEILKSTSLPLDNPEPDINVEGSTFCFTGTFESGTRKEVEAKIEELGGKAVRLNGSTNFLVIGAYATDSWAHSSYGRKIEKALEYKQKGKDVKIVSERHWLKFIK